jgi:hypothetical protein
MLFSSNKYLFLIIYEHNIFIGKGEALLFIERQSGIIEWLFNTCRLCVKMATLMFSGPITSARGSASTQRRQIPQRPVSKEFYKIFLEESPRVVFMDILYGRGLISLAQT